MSYSLSTEPHRVTILKVRSLVEDDASKPLAIRRNDLKTIDEAHEAHIRAKTEFATLNSDQTMINLIGTWSRLTRIKMEMEEKYG